VCGTHLPVAKQTVRSRMAQHRSGIAGHLQAYTDGVNAYPRTTTAPPSSLEYAVLKLLSPAYKIGAMDSRQQPDLGKAMAWDLRTMIRGDRTRRRCWKTLSRSGGGALPLILLTIP